MSGTKEDTKMVDITERVTEEETPPFFEAVGINPNNVYGSSESYFSTVHHKEIPDAVLTLMGSMFCVGAMGALNLNWSNAQFHEESRKDAFIKEGPYKIKPYYIYHRKLLDGRHEYQFECQVSKREV